jgi:selenocysteine-specific elongation factor
VLLHRHAIEQARRALFTAFPLPQSFTTSQARIALSTTRKVIVPLLEHFDTEKTTRRTGDLREMNIPKGVPSDVSN